MILFPAIDLKDGVCVRLEQGDMARATVFNRDPAVQAHEFESQGFDYLHLVDLDGAFAGKPMNAHAVDRILETISIPVQLGGGIRDMATVEGWLTHGVTRVIIGTAAVRDPAFVKDAARRFPDRIAVGLDTRDGKVAVEGWAATSELTALDIARRFEDAGVGAIIYTDISRDGLLKGLNLEATLGLAQSLSIPVIASGGLASLADVEALLRPDAARLAGAIAGRALYDGRLDAAAALSCIRAQAVDPLTGVLNARGLAARKQICLSRIMGGHTFAAMTFDVGDADDRALKAVGTQLAGGRGIVARLTERSFAVLLEDRSADQARAAAERHRDRLARPEAGALTVSCGISGWVEGDTLDALLRRAAVALATAKSRGGGCVVAADPSAPAPPAPDRSATG